jgi:hypothetical protein
MKLKLECGARTMAWLARALKTTGRCNAEESLLVLVYDDCLVFRTAMRTFESVDSWIAVSLRDRETNPYFSFIEVKSKQANNLISMQARTKDLADSLAACCVFEESKTRVTLIKSPDNENAIQLEFRCTLEQFTYEKRVDVDLSDPRPDMIPQLDHEQAEVDLLFASGLNRLLRALEGEEKVDLAVMAERCKACLKGTSDLDSPQVTVLALRCSHARKGGKPDLCDFVTRIVADTEVRALFKEVSLSVLSGTKKVEKRVVKGKNLATMLAIGMANPADRLQLGFDAEAQVYLKVRSDDFAGFVMTCPALTE